MTEKKKRTYSIAIMTGDTQTDYSEEVMRGFYAGAREEGVTIILLMGPQIPSYCTDIVTSSITGNYRYQFHSIYQYAHFMKPDAVILMYGSLSAFYFEQSKRELLGELADIPCFMMEDESGDENVPCLTTDNYGGMRECMEHLIVDHGYQKIVFLSGPGHNHDAKERLKAYRDTMEEHGLTVADSMIAYGDFTDQTEEQAAFLLDNNPGVEAIVCANDAMAKGCYRVCTTRNLIVGKDIAITGFNDVSSACTMNPPLTSVSQNSFQAGFTALKSAVAMCRGEKAKAQCMTAVLRKRCSCGCPPEEILDVKYLPEWEIKGFLEEAALKLAPQIFSMVSYEKDREFLTETLQEYFMYIYETVFAKDGEAFSMDHLFTFLKRIVEYPFLSDEILLKNLTRALQILQANARKEPSRETIAAILSTTRQFMHALRIEKLEHEIYLSDRKAWFVPNFTRDLASEEYMRSPQDIFYRVMMELKKMAVRSAYFFLFDTTVNHIPGEPLQFPEEIGLVACFDNENMKFYHREEKPVFTQKNGFMSYIGSEKPACFIPVILFSEQKQYGLMMCEVDHADIAFLQICSVQLGTLFRFIELNLLEQQAQSDLKNSLRVIREQNRILSFISEYDELTKLLNRRGFIEKALSLYERNEGKRAYLIYGDLDHLKEINDVYGHAEGDFAIKNVAERFRTLLPESAVSGRIGGDEFVSFLLTEEEGYQGRIEKAFAECSRKYNEDSKKPYYIELSVGVYEFICRADVDFDEVIRKSDELLYREKEKRRESVKRPPIPAE